MSTRTRSSSSSRSEASLNSLFSRLANKRRNQPAPVEEPVAQEYVSNTLSNKLLNTNHTKADLRYFSIFLTDIITNITTLSLSC